jgi:hypothetical protein
MASKRNGALDRSPAHLLHRASQVVEEIFQAQVGDSDLTPVGWQCSPGWPGTKG